MNLRVHVEPTSAERAGPQRHAGVTFCRQPHGRAGLSPGGDSLRSQISAATPATRSGRARCSRRAVLARRGQRPRRCASARGRPPGRRSSPERGPARARGRTPARAACRTPARADRPGAPTALGQLVAPCPAPARLLAWSLARQPSSAARPCGLATRQWRDGAGQSGARCPAHGRPRRGGAGGWLGWLACQRSRRQYARLGGWRGLASRVSPGTGRYYFSNLYQLSSSLADAPNSRMLVGPSESPRVDRSPGGEATAAGDAPP